MLLLISEQEQGQTEVFCSQPHWYWTIFWRNYFMPVFIYYCKIQQALVSIVFYLKSLSRWYRREFKRQNKPVVLAYCSPWILFIWGFFPGENLFFSFSSYLAASSALLSLSLIGWVKFLEILLSVVCCLYYLWIIAHRLVCCLIFHSWRNLYSKEYFFIRRSIPIQNLMDKVTEI